ncbi:30S ribosomal protein S21 [Candidatus Peregrinibacteria bacterium]|nr:30S ribosomal protein S21 [Candidatus Peregrinibacteria bacterium]
MIHLKKSSKESNEKLISRFQKKVQGSRIITQSKERMYYKKPIKKGGIRKRAIMREHYRAVREKQKYL